MKCISVAQTSFCSQPKLNQNWASIRLYAVFRQRKNEKHVEVNYCGRLHVHIAANALAHTRKEIRIHGKMCAQAIRLFRILFARQCVFCFYTFRTRVSDGLFIFITSMKVRQPHTFRCAVHTLRIYSPVSKSRESAAQAWLLGSTCRMAPAANVGNVVSSFSELWECTEDMGIVAWQYT